ncbi:uncharacterized protein LOC120079052 isoform X2 [Benincasa hispida]|uniref:uncharacterized protein LOC120079052 isoform X2 n=1 Tax=Benincasa hispida TaxID=102211 RepID=UPI0018FF38BD|nr:uncharacterized protein LOC120079052 isoform X2 [Benincasa hispida]
MFQKHHPSRFQKHALFSLHKTEEPISKVISRMKLLSNTQFSFPVNEHLYNILVVLFKALLVLFCALFPLLLGYFRYFKTSNHKQPLFEENCDEALQESFNHNEIETPFSALSFRFPTYEEFLTNRENVDSVRSDTSNESDFLEEHCSIPSNPDPNFSLHPKEVSENVSPNGLDCTNDVRIEDDNGFDEFDDSIEASKIEDSAEIESEDDNFIKALQIQIMKAKADAKAKSVLPSIPEESEYPITNENDLKPWKKEESFNHRDSIKELHIFHKLYIEKMRKYDTLNHQNTYAKELRRMQSKESVESVLSRGFCGCKPDKKTGETRGIDEELELVYVMQLWVSWEFIVWQYKKTLEIYGREGYGGCIFNEVAEKFEHFQVMIQRFMENESFDEGSRVECYVRNRLARRKLLQVPLVKRESNEREKIEEDSKEKKVHVEELQRGYRRR